MSEQSRFRLLASFLCACALLACAAVTGTQPARAATAVVPSAPRNLHASAVTRTSVSLSWSAPASRGSAPLIGYRLRRADAAGPRMVSARATTTTASKLVPGRTYRWSLWAVNSRGSSAAATLTVRTTPPPSAPSAPRNLRATAVGSTSVTLAWSVPASHGSAPLTGYRLQRADAAGPRTVSPQLTTTTASGLAPGTSYTWSLRALNSVGASAAAVLTVRTAPAPVTSSPPSAPQNLRATAVSSTGLTLAWSAPASLGTAPLTAYQLSRAGVSGVQTLAPTSTSINVASLSPGTTYGWSLTAVSAAGTSPAATLTITTIAVASPIPPQTSPAPVSTSHYLRNLTGVASHDVPLMQKMGAVDAPYNPSGHRYLVLQDIGAQTSGGVLLSATAKFVSYTALVRALEAFVDGYHSTQRANAPMLLALGTNNDGSVSSAAGALWADDVVDPVRSYAAKYSNITVAGADDMEPGFYAGISATRAWLSGYLGATTAKFVFNGSADGCPTGASGGGCNNGWSTSSLNWLSGGAAPSRILSLPQIYNSAMPYQWRNISASGAKVDFAGPLTEWTACSQAGGCSSATNVSAWTMLFKALATNSRTAVTEMPYGTDLRIN